MFTNLLAHADSAGWVDIHPRAISDETGLTIDEVSAAIRGLESPDPDSRSPEEDGRRIVQLDIHRAWGWRIVNHGKYRAIRDEADRREQNRIAQEKFRNKNKPKTEEVSNSNHSKPRKPISAQAEAEAEAEAYKPSSATDVAVPEYSKAFLSFWELYPNRKNKGAAFKAFKRVKPAEYQSVKSGLEVAKKSAEWLKDNGQFIPHPSTWLNARGWEDEAPGSAAYSQDDFMRKIGAIPT